MFTSFKDRFPYVKAQLNELAITTCCYESFYLLTYNQVEFPTHANLTSPFWCKGMLSGIFFIFLFKFNRIFC